MPFAQAHSRGPLFAYAGPGHPKGRGNVHDGHYAVIDVETTGFSPQSGDRVVELAVAIVDANGRIQDEFATLVNPDGRDTGPVFVHGISNEAVASAPQFREIAGELLCRLAGAVIVAHNAPFEERFLAAEFARAGINLSAPLPALCTLWLSQRTLHAPNYRLGTLCETNGVPLVDKHAALGDVRAVSALLPRMLDALDQPLVYCATPAIGLAPGYVRGSTVPRTRAAALRKGDEGWMASIIARLPITGAVTPDPQAEAYLHALMTVLEDGKITGDEAKTLAKLAGSAGMGASQVAALNSRFLEDLFTEARADGVLTRAEVRDLCRAATALGQPGRFADLTPTQPVKRTIAANASNHRPSGAKRGSRIEHALLAAQRQREGITRADIGLELGVSVDTVKQLLRDGKFYEAPDADPQRHLLAQAALTARESGVSQANFRTNQGLSPGKAAEAWRDAAFLATRGGPPTPICPG